ncbi:MAG: ribonucleotide reductase small subunit [Bacteriophage sp.]|nr:MAG: ribonucleotide reductase small subunit [Bacteriophage sp.]
MTEQKITLTSTRQYYKPFSHPWAYEYAEEHRRMNWTKEEVRTLHEDIADWKSMSEEERAPLQFLLNYFVQADVDVGASYFENLARYYSLPEIRMAITRIIDREATHVDNYDMLPDQFGIPLTEYKEMLAIDEIAEQHDFMVQQTLSDELFERISTISRHICGEGIGLYGIFLMLLNAQRFGKMKALGQEIVSWSARDENHHCEFLTWLLNTELAENSETITGEYLEILRNSIIAMFKNSVTRGVNYAKAVYARGALPDLTVDQIEHFLKQLADVRISKLNLGIETIYGTEKVLELDWASMLFSASLDNFFETAGTNYQIGAITGEWEYPEKDFKKDSHKYAELANS